MLWHATNAVIELGGLRRSTRLIVLAESPETVLDTLLIRPSEKQALWATGPGDLDFSRLDGLTVLGELSNACVPSKGAHGHWGFRTQHDGDNGKGLARFTQQLNLSAGALTALAEGAAGTLLWVTEDSTVAHQSDTSLRRAWTAAPLAGFLGLSPTKDYTTGDSLAVTFATRPVHAGANTSDYVLAAPPGGPDLGAAMDRVVQEHPYTAQT